MQTVARPYFSDAGGVTGGLLVLLGLALGGGAMLAALSGSYYYLPAGLALAASGGHGSTGTTPGDYVIAYALPKAR